MFDKEINIGQIIALRMSQDLSEADELLLQNWLKSDPANRRLFDELTREDLLREKWSAFEATDRKAVWNNVQQRLASLTVNTTERRKIRLWPRLTAAACFALLVGAGLFFYRSKLKEGQTNLLTAQKDILPGRQGATLTLANGRRIKLSHAANGEIAREAGVMVSKTVEGQLVYEIQRAQNDSHEINTLATARGETYVLTLPDKSKVWMNAASSLTYFTALNVGGKRRVKLQGEAYFEIAKDKKHPFVVESKGQEVEVLGTHFNVSAYHDETAVTTTLLEGSVKISPLTNVQGVVLKPGQQAKLSGSDLLKVTAVDAGDAISWRNGLFIFDNETLETAMLKLGRWYNVDVSYKDSGLKQLDVGGSITRYGNIGTILKMFEKAGDVKFIIKGKTIIVSN